MSHFYGTVQGNRGKESRGGSQASGVETHAASWKGAVRTVLFIDDQGRDCFRVEQVPWRGVGVYETLAEGVIGEFTNGGGK